MNVNAVSGGQQSHHVDQATFQSRVQATWGPVAQLFGESVDQLKSDLETGNTSLTDLAKQKGISQDDLLAAIKQGLQARSALGGPTFSDTRLTNLANRIANHRHGTHHQSPPATDPTAGAPSTTTSTSLAL